MAAESDSELDAQAGEALDRLFADAHADVASRAELGRVAQRLGIQHVGDSMAPPAAKVAATKWLLAGLGSALLVVGGYVVVTHSSEPVRAPDTKIAAATSAAPHAAPALLPSEPVANEDQEAPPAAAPKAERPRQVLAPVSGSSKEAAPAATAEDAPVAAEPAPAPSSAPALSELGLLRSARAELGSSPAHALELVEQHESLFPASKLVQEREVVAIEALLKLGQRSAAEARAQAFERRYPGSAYRAKLDALFGRK